MKKNYFKLFIMTLLVLSGYILGAVMCYLILFEGVHFTLDFTTVENAVDTIGELMITAIPILTGIYSLAAIHDKVREMDEKEKIRKRHEMFYNTYASMIR